MEVNKFIATVFILLVETSVANLETVKIKLGRKEVIIPLSSPVHVTRLEGGDLSNLRLPVPNLADIISQSRTPPLQPPPLPRLPTAPDRWVADHLFQQNSQFNQQQPLPYIPNPQDPPPINYFPNNNPQLVSSAQAHARPQPTLYPEQILQQNGLPSYSETSQDYPLTQNQNNPLPPSQHDEHHNFLKKNESSSSAPDPEQPSTAKPRDHRIPLIPKDRYQHRIQTSSQLQQKPLSQNKIPSLHDRLPDHQNPLSHKEYHTLLSTQPKPISHKVKPTFLNKQFKHHDNITHEDDHPLLNKGTDSDSKTQERLLNQQELPFPYQNTTGKDSSVPQTTPTLVEDAIKPHRSSTLEYVQKSQTTTEIVEETVLENTIDKKTADVHETKKKIELTTFPTIDTSYATPAISSNIISLEPKSPVQETEIVTVTEPITNNVITSTYLSTENTVTLYPTSSLVDDKVQSETTLSLLEDATTLRPDETTAIDNGTSIYSSTSSISLQEGISNGAEASLIVKSTTASSEYSSTDETTTVKNDTSVTNIMSQDKENEKPPIVIVLKEYTTQATNVPTTSAFDQSVSTDTTVPINSKIPELAVTSTYASVPKINTKNELETSTSTQTTLRPYIIIDRFIYETTTRPSVPNEILYTTVSSFLAQKATTVSSITVTPVDTKSVSYDTTVAFGPIEDIPTTVAIPTEPTQMTTDATVITDVSGHDTTTKKISITTIDADVQKPAIERSTKAIEHSATSTSIVDTTTESIIKDTIGDIPTTFSDQNPMTVTSTLNETTVNSLIQDTTIDVSTISPGIIQTTTNLPMTSFTDQDTTIDTNILNQTAITPYLEDTSADVTTISSKVNALTESDLKITTDVIALPSKQYTSPVINAMTESTERQTVVDLPVTYIDQNTATDTKQTTVNLLAQETTTDVTTVVDLPVISSDKYTARDTKQTTANVLVQETTTDVTTILPTTEVTTAVNLPVRSTDQNTTIDTSILKQTTSKVLVQETTTDVTTILPEKEVTTVVDLPVTSTDQNTELDTSILKQTTSNVLVQETTTDVTTISPITEVTTAVNLPVTSTDQNTTIDTSILKQTTSKVLVQETTTDVTTILPTTEVTTVVDLPVTSTDQNTELDTSILKQTTSNVLVQETTTDVTTISPITEVTTAVNLPVTSTDQNTTIDTSILKQTTFNVLAQETTTDVTTISPITEVTTAVNLPVTHTDQKTAIDTSILKQTTANVLVQETTTDVTTLLPEKEVTTVVDLSMTSTVQNTAIDTSILKQTTSNVPKQEPTTDITTILPGKEETTASIAKETRDVPVTLPSEQYTPLVINIITGPVERQAVAVIPETPTDQNTAVDTSIINETTPNVLVQETTTDVTTTLSVVNEKITDLPETHLESTINTSILNELTTKTVVQTTTSGAITKSLVAEYVNSNKVVAQRTIIASPIKQNMTIISTTTLSTPITTTSISKLLNTTKNFTKGTTAKPRRRRPCKKHRNRIGSQSKNSGSGRRRRKRRSTTVAPFTTSTPSLTPSKPPVTTTSQA